MTLLILWITGHLAARAQDPEPATVIKSQHYVQESDALPGLDVDSDEDPLRFEVFVEGTDDNGITAGSVRFPDGSTRELDTDEGELFLQETFLRKAILDATYPDGLYRLSFQTDYGSGPAFDLDLNLTGDAFPNIPRIRNLDTLDGLDAGGSVTLTWDPFLGAGEEDVLIVEIEEIRQFNDETIYETGFLPGTNTSLVLPVGTLNPGNRYLARLILANVVDTDDGPVSGAAAYVRVTHFGMSTAPDDDSTPPILDQTRPSSFEEAVPVSSVLAFDFNERMDTGTALDGSVAVAGLDTTGWTYQWSDDARTLFAIPGALLPEETSIQWQLNPPPGSDQIRDQAGNALGTTYSGSFTTASAPGIPASDAMDIAVAKAILLSQTEASGSQPAGLFLATINLDQAGFNTVLSATLTPPLPASVISIRNKGEDQYLDADWFHASKSNLDAFLPDGQHLLELETAHDGLQTVSLTLNGDDYPVDPSITNFDQSQSIDGAQPFTLHWTPFSGGTSNDFIFLEITDSNDDVVFETPDLEEPDRLTSGATSVDIPADALPPDSTLTANLEFIRIKDVNTADYPGATALAGYLKILSFEITTTNQPAPPLLAIDVNASVGPEIRLRGGQGDSAYVLEASTNVVDWSTVSLQWTDFDGFFTWIDTEAVLRPARFYRARSFNLGQGVLIQGQVFDQEAFVPLPGVLVTTSLDGATAVTDQLGLFTLATQVEGDFSNTPFTLQLTLPGYSPFSQMDFWGNEPTFQTIFLQPSP